MSELIQAMTDADFNQVLSAEQPVLVDFWAEWCGPCKNLSPILEEVAEEYKGRITIYKVNVDENTEVPSQFGVMSIPTLILFKNGNVEGTKVGFLTKSQLTAFIEASL